MVGFEDFVSELGDFGAFKGTRFEEAAYWWLENDPIWSSQLKKVWLWRDWPGRSTRDIGIDLVGLAHDGTTWAIQCKAENPDRALVKSKVDSFLATSSSSRFGHRLLITTCKSLSANLRAMLIDQAKPVVVVDWGALQAADVDWRKWREPKRTSKPHPARLFRHQEAAVKATLAHLKRARRAQLRMACGSGKTRVAIEVALKRGDRLVVVAVPGLTLLGQWVREWSVTTTTPFRWIAVCSDDSVGGDVNDSFATYQQGIPTTTSSPAIAAFLKGRGPKVVFTTYQSASQVGRALRSVNKQADLLIADEAHRIAGQAAGSGGVVLDDKYVPARRRLFMTATPRVFTSSARTRASELGIRLESMDDQDSFGVIAFDYPLSKAIRDGRLNDYRVVIVGVDSGEVRRDIGKRRLVRAGKRTTDAASLATYVAIEKAIRRFKLRRLITFHSRVTRAAEFRDVYPQVREWLPRGMRASGTLRISVISGDMSVGIRRATLQELDSLDLADRMVVSNARCLTEGIDVPSLDGVVFVDPRFSQVDIVQAVGRAIRKSRNGNEIGTVVVPIFIGAGEDASTAIATSDFARVAAVINALRAHDATLGEQLDALRLDLGRRGGLGKLPGKIVWDLPKSVGRGFARSLSVQVLERTSSNWDFQFGQLLRFVDHFGHAQVPQAFGRNDGHWRGLGSWVTLQRSQYRSRLLRDEQIRLLEDLPGWSWAPKSEAWEVGLAEARAAIEVYGSIDLVPRAFRSESGYRVGQWIQVQRSTAGSQRLTQQQRESLEGLAGWSWDPRQEQWQRGYEAAKAWLKTNSIMPPADLKIHGGREKLRNWLKVNLKAYNHPRSPIDKERRERLELLPNWDLLANPYLRPSRKPSRHRSSYEDVRSRFGPEASGKPVEMHALADFLDALSDYFEEYGNLDIPTNEGQRGSGRSYVYRGFPLGQRVNKYRTEYAAGTLSEWKIEAIEASGPWVWNVREAAWESGFHALETFVARYGHSNVPQDFKLGDYALGSWVARQRRTHARSDLSRERQRRLEKLPGWVWNASQARNLSKRQEKWERNFALLKRFAEREGHARVPAGHLEEGVPLGRWVAYLRAANRGAIVGAKRPAKDERRRLEALPGWSWAARRI